MTDFFNWLSSNPLATNTIIISFAGLILALVFIYVVAFFQGRDISFWPPKIGQQPDWAKRLKGQNQATRADEKKQATYLKSRTEFQPLGEQFATASEIVLVAVSGNSLFGPHYALLERKLKEGCKLRVVLLDPEGKAVKMWDAISKEAILSKSIPTESEIISSLNYLKALIRSEKTKGLCEVRLTNFFLPYSMIIVNPHTKDTCSVIVEFHAFQTPPSNRPHIRLDLDDQPWFDFYLKQFEDVWASTKEWKPPST